MTTRFHSRTSVYPGTRLTLLLSLTLIYCIVLERRLAAVRKGQEGLKTTIGELNAAISGAGASLRALKSAAGESAELLDTRLKRARALADELALLSSSGERIAERFDRAVRPAKRSRGRRASVRQRYASP